MGVKIDRFNGNTSRRYHHPSRAIIIVRSDRKAACIPASCPHIAPSISRSMAATLILEARAAR